MVISYNGTPEGSESQSLHHVLLGVGVRMPDYNSVVCVRASVCWCVTY